MKHSLTSYVLFTAASTPIVVNESFMLFSLVVFLHFLNKHLHSMMRSESERDRKRVSAK